MEKVDNMLAKIRGQNNEVHNMFCNQHIGDQLQVRDPSSNVHLRLDHDPGPIKWDPFARFATPKLSQKIWRKKKRPGHKYFTFFFPKQLAQRSSAGVTNRKWTKVDHVVRIWSWTFWFHLLSHLFYFPRSSFFVLYHFSCWWYRIASHIYINDPSR